jgi:hypothetical protein
MVGEWKVAGVSNVLHQHLPTHCHVPHKPLAHSRGMHGCVLQRQWHPAPQEAVRELAATSSTLCRRREICVQQYNPDLWVSIWNIYSLHILFLHSTCSLTEYSSGLHLVHLTSSILNLMVPPVKRTNPPSPCFARASCNMMLSSRTQQTAGGHRNREPSRRREGRLLLLSGSLWHWWSCSCGSFRRWPGPQSEESQCIDRSLHAPVINDKSLQVRSTKSTCSLQPHRKNTVKALVAQLE